MTRNPGRGFLFVWGIVLLSLFPAWADAGAEVSLPKVSAQLVFEKAAFFLGENVLAHYGITNTGTQDISVETGGDYRGAPRALRFEVSAVDEKGKAVDDPYRDIITMGGISGPFTLKPGETFWASLALSHYCDFTAPGTYTVQVYHDLGWGARTAASPVAVGKLTLTMPTARQAASVVAGMAALPRDTGWTHGQRRSPYPDFTVLRYPVYLPPLLARAQDGDIRAIDGIAAIRTPQATRALMNLSSHANREIADRALDALLLRLPVAEGSTRQYWGTRLRGLSEWSWSGHLAPDVFTIGWRALESRDRQRLIQGARILETMGKADDLPRLVPVLDRVITMMKDDPVEQNDYPRPATACGALVWVCDALVARGGRVSATHSTAQGILQLCAIKQDITYRPAGWQSTARTLLTHPIPFVRATALERLPLPLDRAFVDQVDMLIHDSYIATQAAALDIAMRTKDGRFGKDVLEVLATTTDEWIVRNAFPTATACGVPLDQIVEVCVNRFEEPKMAAMFFNQFMTSVFANEGGYGTSGDITADEARRLKARWQRFLADNREALRASTAFTIAAPPVTEDLLPAGYHFYRKDGSRWPPQE